MDLECADSIKVIISDFHSEDQGSIPCPRSKDRRIGKWENCLNCNKQFPSYKHYNKWSKFCSYNCKNISIAKTRKKRPIKHIVNDKRIRNWCFCGEIITGYKVINCKKCNKIIKRNNILDKTLDLFRNEKSVQPKHKYQKIRNIAKKIIEELKWEKICAMCKYSKHVELAHIKSISSFPDSATIREINSLNNLIYLCPTHHWELDNNQLEI